MTSASTVGLPRESIICRPMTRAILVDIEWLASGNSSRVFYRGRADFADFKSFVFGSVHSKATYFINFMDVFILKELAAESALIWCM
jgi:hypothetical protein